MKKVCSRHRRSKGVDQTRDGRGCRRLPGLPAADDHFRLARSSPAVSVVKRLGKVALSHFVDDILLKFLFDGRKTCCTGLRSPISTPFAIRS
jgi:hypothetical protein